MKYRVLVADDEAIIRRGIIRLLRKYDDIYVVGEAEDGEMALEIAREEHLDILFVDINMPIVNGLQFIEALKKFNDKAIIVVITGYDDFNYARQALRLGVFEYLLKPLMEAPFYQAVDKAMAVLKQREKEERYFDWAKRSLQKNQERLISGFLEKWIEGHYQLEEIKDRKEYLDIHLAEEYVLLLIHLEHLETVDIYHEWDDDLLYYAARNIIDELFNDSLQAYTLQTATGDLLLITSKTEDSRRIIEAKKAETIKVIEEYLPVKTVALLGEETSFDRLPFLYEELAGRMSDLKEHPSVIKVVKSYIEENYQKEDLSLTDVAKHSGISPQHLSRMFKKDMGITFSDYLTGIRIRRAIELLHHEELKMYEIAEKTGYASQHYFSSVFKKNIGISPAEYRKDLKKEQQKG